MEKMAKNAGKCYFGKCKDSLERVRRSESVNEYTFRVLYICNILKVARQFW